MYNNLYKLKQDLATLIYSKDFISEGNPISPASNCSNLPDNKSFNSCGLTKPNYTECPKITEDEKEFLYNFRFWIGGVVSCCVATTGKHQMF